jgi:choline dehydrogenase-like flavoprotein
MGWVLTAAERNILRAVATTAIPPGRLLPGASEATVDRVEGALASLGSAVQTVIKGLLWSLELGALPLQRGRFSTLPFGRRLAALEALEKTEATRLALRGLLVLIKLCYTDDRSVYSAINCRWEVERPAKLEPAKWRAQMMEATALVDQDDLECDVVVVGTGAGGAPLADALASHGLAVLLVEEGQYFSRQDFTGRPMDMMKKMYRRGGFTMALGNTAIAIPVGKGVGGTTLINSGTCFRTPPQVLKSWKDAHGVEGMSADELAPYYERVEKFLEVGPSSKKALGRVAELIAKGCDALGYSHHPLNRNAPGCDGQGLCCFGCPTDAKRSTNVSYVPAALDHGAQLITGLRVDRVLMEGGRAAGVEGVVKLPLRDARVRIRAKATVLACGALHTPTLLLKQGLANRSDQVGRNLTIHPAPGAIAIMDEPVSGWSSVPQGYSIDEFKDEGLMFEGATAPLEIASVTVSSFGPKWTSFLESLDRMLMFGFMVKDTSRGRVKPGANGEPSIRYWMNDHDVAKVRRGLGILSRVFFAAGAQEVHLPIAGSAALKGLDDVAAFEKAPLAARHVDITAYHPLGTCRIGPDPKTSVLKPTHETHDVESLFVVDGSVMPSSLGVNPQMTIMAMALKASEAVAKHVEAAYARAA